MQLIVQILVELLKPEIIVFKFLLVNKGRLEFVQLVLETLVFSLQLAAVFFQIDELDLVLVQLVVEFFVFSIQSIPVIFRICECNLKFVQLSM
jgi:hypothetical protein